MSHESTSRYGIRSAPGGLALVQDLLNTRQIQPYGDDLLATAESATSWLSGSLPAELSDGQHWPGPPSEGVLSDRELADFRSLRSDVLKAIGGAGRPNPEPVGTAVIVLTPSGEVRLAAGGSGAARYASAVWLEIFLAQRADVWRRLKVCRSEPCGSAFYDHSRNNSGVWHDASTCGNRENLRKSRTRRRVAPAVGG